MKRDIALFSGQWADLDIAEVVEKAHGWGYDGLELASWGRHLDLPRALSDESYRNEIRSVFDRFGMTIDAISNHLVGQAVSEHYIDKRH